MNRGKVIGREFAGDQVGRPADDQEDGIGGFDPEFHRKTRPILGQLAESERQKGAELEENERILSAGTIFFFSRRDRYEGTKVFTTPVRVERMHPQGTALWQEIRLLQNATYRDHYGIERNIAKGTTLYVNLHELK